MHRSLSLFFALLAAAGCASAEDPKLEKARDRITEALPGIERGNVQPSAIPGLYEIHRGAVFGYITGDGRYLIQGDLVDMKTGEEITEKRRMAMRVDVLKQFSGDQAIVFGPKDAAHTVTVFTDIDCGYCRRMHNEMPAYNAQGIAVRYLFFPRSGPQTPSFEKAQSVWCSADRREALTQAKRGVNITAPSSCPNPVLKHWQAGEALGVNATPMIMLPDGEMVRGYVPPGPLAARLNGSATATR